MLPPVVCDLRRPAFCSSVALFRPKAEVPDWMTLFRRRLSYQGLTLGVFLRLGEKDPTSAAAEPATVVCGAGSPFIPDIHHSQTSALDPIPALCLIRTTPGRGRGTGEERGATGRRRRGLPSIGIQGMLASDAARPRRGERRCHIWNCRCGLPWSPAVPPRGPYKERVGHWGVSRRDASCYQAGL